MVPTTTLVFLLLPKRVARPDKFVTWQTFASTSLGMVLWGSGAIFCVNGRRVARRSFRDRKIIAFFLHRKKIFFSGAQSATQELSGMKG